MLQLAELLKRWDVTIDALFAPLGIAPSALAMPDAKISVSDVARIIERALLLSGEPGLGFYFGAGMRVAAHGHVGLAAMSASTLGEAIELAVTFARTRTDALALRLDRGVMINGTSGKTRGAAFVVEELSDFGAARETVLCALFYGMVQIGESLTGTVLEGRAEFTFPEPSYFARFAEIARNVSFDHRENRLIFDEKLLSLPVLMSDPVTMRMAREQCEHRLEAIAASEDIVARTRRIVAGPDGTFRTLEEAARMMHISTRTLKRRLSEAGSAFSVVRNDAQQAEACRMLKHDDTSIEQIADQLGYSDVANFTRAFRRWTGQTPAAYRKAQKPLSI